MGLDTTGHTEPMVTVAVSDVKCLPSSIDGTKGADSLGYRIVLAVVCVLASIFSLASLQKIVVSRMSDPNYNRETYDRVSFWLKSADCTLKTGTFLALVDDRGRPSPIEAHCIADDLGQALMANLLAYTTRAPVTYWTLTRANVVVNAVGVVLLALILLSCRWILPAILVPLAGAWVGIPRVILGPDNDAIFLGAYCLALILPIFLGARLGEGRLSGVWDSFLFLVGAMSLAAAVLLRQPIGVIGVLLSLVLAVALGISERPKGKLWGIKYLVVVGLIVGTHFISSGLVGVRNYLFELSPSGNPSQHGFSHALYLGLGTEANPWGIAWSDASAFKAAQRVNPKVASCSKEYFSIVRSLYLGILWNHPREVLGIYARKFQRICSYRTDWLPWRVRHYLVSIPILLGAFLLCLRAHPRLRVRLLPAGVLYCFSLLFLMQGVFAIPDPVYLYPVYFGFLANLIVLLCVPLP